jgi:hypothetical protein
MKEVVGRHFIPLAFLSLFVYAAWYVNGTRYGFSMAWFAIAFLGWPLLLWSLALYFRAAGAKVMLSPKEKVVMASLMNLFLFLSTFEFIGWYSLVFPLTALPIILWEATKITAGGASRD